MNWSFIASTKGGSASDPFTTASMDTTGANFLVAAWASGGGTAVVTDSKSCTWTPLTKQGSGGGATQLVYAKNATVGTGHTFTLSSTVNNSLVVLAFGGGDTTAPFDVENGVSTGGSTTLQPGSLTPGSDNELVVTGCSIVVNATTLTINSGFATVVQQDYLNGTYFGVGMSYVIQTTAAAVNPTWTGSVASSCGCATIASFKVGAGGGTDSGIKSNRPNRPAPFKPMGDAFRPAAYRGWR